MADSTAASAYADFRSASYFPSLNGIRAICALLVVKEHAHWAIAQMPRMLEWGFLGVDMFFVISGFLIVTLLLRERERRGAIDLKQFYVRRTLRIFPIYYLVIAALFVLAVATYRHSTRTWDLYKWAFPVLLLYLQDVVPVSLGLLFHTWSLAMEEQFYLIWPSVEKYLRAAWIVPLLLLLIVLCQLFNFGLMAEAIVRLYGPDGPSRSIYQITFTPILLGVLAAHAMHDPSVGLALTRMLRHRWTPLVLLGAAMAVCQYCAHLQGLARLLVHVLFCLALLAMVVNPRGVFSGALQSRPLFYIGSISYGVYLYHTFVLWGIALAGKAAGFALNPAATFGLCALLTIALAGLSFRFLESPLMNRRRRAQPPSGTIAPARAA